MTDLDEYLPLITPHAPGCPDPTAFEYLIQAAQRFCEDTRLWRSDDSFQLSKTGCEFVCTPDGADLHEITAASVCRMPLEPIGFDELNRQFPGWREEDSSPQYISQSADNTVIIYPSDGESTVQLKTILRPSNDATQLPDFLYRKHKQDIANGALSMILMLPNQSFTDPARGQMFGATFQARIDKLNTLSTQGQQRAPMRSKGSYF